MTVICEPRDAGSIADLEKECFTDPWREEDILSTMSNRCNHAAAETDDSGVFRGYVMYSIVCDVAEILRVCVKYDFRRRGIAEKLIGHVVDDAKRNGCTRIFLEVRRSNVAAAGLYRKAGFKELSVRKKYYPGGEDALVFTLDPV